MTKMGLKLMGRFSFGPERTVRTAVLTLEKN